MKVKKLIFIRIDKFQLQLIMKNFLIALMLINKPFNLMVFVLKLIIKDFLL